MGTLIELIDTLIAYILYGSREELIKHKTLRTMRNELGPENAKFIDKHGKKVTAYFPAKIHQLFRVIETLRELIPLDQKESDNLLANERLRDFLVLRRLPEDYRSEHLNFSYEVMEERISSAEEPKNEVWRKLDKEFSDFRGYFKDEKYFGIDESLAQLERFSSLMEFDFISFLGQFDPLFTQSSTPVTPNFSTVSAEQVQQDLLDFYYVAGKLEISPALRSNLEYLLEYYKKYSASNMQILRESIDHIELLFENGLKEEVFRTMLCLIEFDPYFEPKVMGVERAYLEEFLSKWEELFNLNKERLRSRILDDRMKLSIEKIFEGEPLEETFPYDEETENLFMEKGFSAFSQRQPLRLLKSYYHRRFKKGLYGSLKKIADEGYFENREFKEWYAGLLSRIEGHMAEIEQFESSLSGRGAISMEDMKKIVKKDSISESDAASVKRFLQDINGRARRVVEENSKLLKELVVAGGRIVEDYRAKNPKHVSNLRTIAGERSGGVLRRVEEGTRMLTELVEVLKHYTVIKQEPKENGAAESS